MGWALVGSWMACPVFYELCPSVQGFFPWPSSFPCSMPMWFCAQVQLVCLCIPDVGGCLASLVKWLPVSRTMDSGFRVLMFESPAVNFLVSP